MERRTPSFSSQRRRLTGEVLVASQQKMLPEMTRRTRRRRIYSPTTKSHRGFLSESVWSTSSEDSQKRKRWPGRFIFLIHERRKGEANAQPRGMMVRQSRVGEGVAGSCKFDPSGGGEVKSWGGWSSCLSLSLSALHPKVLCELLHLQQVFGVDGGTGGGQRAQHVRLQRKQRYRFISFNIWGDLSHLKSTEKRQS